MFFGRFLIILNCSLYAALAVWALVLPITLFEALAITASTRAAVIELQVLIAGSFLGFCFLVGAGIIDKRKTKRSLVGLFIINAAWFVTRCITLLEGLPQQSSTLIYMGFEFAMLLFLLIALRLVTGPRGRTLFRQEDATF
ncbi:MAG TPA: hypothetical protein DEF72_03805 [Gammaproteobacteria bacterium]|nr:hypothetical protein [Gammaproteobacteria bacterium]